MNKISSILIALVMLLCLCACNKCTTPDNKSTTVSAKENPTLQPTTCDHDWKAATCTTPKTCSKCNISKGGVAHTWKVATCTTPKTCIHCGQTEGTSLGHDFGSSSSSRCKICGYLPYSAYEITVRFHYMRPDGDYEGWNLWLWDDNGRNSFDPPYGFEVIDGEAICEFKVRAGTGQIGYIVRYGDWIAKDVDKDQFIDLTGIHSGKVGFYVNSGEESGELVLYPVLAHDCAAALEYNVFTDALSA